MVLAQIDNDSIALSTDWQLTSNPLTEYVAVIPIWNHHSQVSSTPYVRYTSSLVPASNIRNVEITRYQIDWLGTNVMTSLLTASYCTRSACRSYPLYSKYTFHSTYLVYMQGTISISWTDCTYQIHHQYCAPKMWYRCGCMWIQVPRLPMFDAPGTLHWCGRFTCEI